MRSPKRYIWPAALVLLGVALLPTVASSVEPTPTIKAVNVPGGIYEKHYWSPTQQTVMTGGVVTFSNATTVAHGVEWLSAVKPKCEEGEGKVPVGTAPAASAPEWSGNCTFTQAGTYTFYCTVHGPEMTGTITVKSEGEPVAVTGVAGSIGETEATLNGTVDPEGNKTTYFFKYGRSTSYENGSTPPGELAAVKASEPVSAPLTGLAAGITYHYKLFAKNSAGTKEGTDRVFTTQGPPSATTNVATEVGETEATLEGTVNPDGKSTKSFFEWGTSESYGHLTAEVSAGEDHFNHTVSETLTGLLAGTVYHFRLVAKNATEVHGADQMFTTTSLSAPPSESLPASTTTPTTTPPTAKTSPEPLPGPPIEGSPSLGASQHGSLIRGSLEISRSAAGARLEVDLLAKRASLAKTRRSGSVRVGRLVRASVSAGRVSFSVALTPAGRHALARKHRLPLTVKITLTPPRGTTVSIARSVTLRS